MQSLGTNCAESAEILSDTFIQECFFTFYGVACSLGIICGRMFPRENTVLIFPREHTTSPIYGKNPDSLGDIQSV